MITKKALLDLYSELYIRVGELEDEVEKLKTKQPRTKDGKFAKKK